MGFYNLETLKEDARRHSVRVLNPDVNRSREKCVVEGDALRLGFLNVAKVGPVAAQGIVEAREQGTPFTVIGDFMARSGLSREALDNLADAGAFDSMAHDRRAVRWEIGLCYRPVNEQLAMPMPVNQDMVNLPELTEWERMDGEYRTMGLYPEGHVMSHLSLQLGPGVTASQQVQDLEDGTEVTVAGLVIRRQRPLGKAVFITLEDQFGHTPLILWPKVYERFRKVLKEPIVKVKGTVSRRDGTMNVLVSHAWPISALGIAPKAKNWG